MPRESIPTKHTDAAKNLAPAERNADELSVETRPLELRDFTTGTAGTKFSQPAPIPNTQLDLRIELGRAHMPPDEARELVMGSVVALDKLASDPVDVFVNGRLIARGEVLVHSESFCVRISELIVPKAA
jgi:flagellar motor switch protein FliN